MDKSQGVGSLIIGGRDERDFGLETETETRVVSVSVSSFETGSSKSQSQSRFLRPKGQSLSILK